MKCSVLLPVHNGVPAVRVAIESILAQSQPDFEFLIVDDGSTDRSADIIREYARRDPRIRPVFHSENMGLCHTLNEGLELARTNLVARMDHDDESLPDRLRLQVGYMEGQPEIAVAGTYVYHMGRHPNRDRLVRLPSSHHEIVKVLPVENCIYHPSVILRRDAILRLGGYRPQLGNAEDYDLWLRASRIYRLANLEVPLLRYRLSAEGLTLGKKWEQLYYVKMALVSYQRPELSWEELKVAARDLLAETDKGYFLEQVTRGTFEELIRLGQWKDAVRILALVRHLEPRRRVRLLVHAVETAVSELGWGG